MELVPPGIKPPCLTIKVAVDPVWMQMQLDVMALFLQCGQLPANSVQTELQPRIPSRFLTQTLEVECINEEREPGAVTTGDFGRFFRWSDQTVINRSRGLAEEQFIIETQQNLRDNHFITFCQSKAHSTSSRDVAIQLPLAARSSTGTIPTALHYRLLQQVCPWIWSSKMSTILPPAQPSQNFGIEPFLQRPEKISRAVWTIFSISVPIR